MVWTWLVEKIGIKGLLLTIGTLALGLCIFLAWRHYTGLLDTINTLKVNSALLKTAVESQDKTIDAQQKVLADWKHNQEEMKKLVNESVAVSKEANAELRRLNVLFVKHDLEVLAGKKPGLIQNRINVGSDRARKLLECASGTSDPDCATLNRKTK